MKKAVHFIKGKLALVAVVVAATAVGGVASTVVSAAIPDGDGVIHGCYRNSSNLLDAKGALKIIDSDSESCSGQETAISWSNMPGGPVAYAHINYTSVSGPVINSTYSQGIDSAYVSPVDPAYVCLIFDSSITNPHTILSTADAAQGSSSSSLANVSASEGGVDAVSDYCTGASANAVLVANIDSQFYVTIY